MSRKVLLVLLLVLLAVALGVGGYFGYRWWQMRLSLSELHGALVLTNTPGGGGALYQWNGSDFAPITSPGARIESVARAGSHLAFIERTPGDLRFSVVVDGKIVYASPTPKENLSLAPDGSAVAFGEYAGPLSVSTTTSASSTVATSTPAAGNVASSTVADWQSVVLNLSTDASTTFPQSFSPLLVDAHHLIRFTAKGMLATDLSKPLPNDTVYVGDVPFTDPFMTIMLAPDRKDLLWIYPQSKVATVFWIPVTAADYPVRQTHIPVPDSAAFTISDTALYELRYRAGGTELWSARYESRKPVFVYKFPLALPVRSILFST